MANVKTVEISRDDITYFGLPGNTADISRESSDTDDSIFGTAFSSSQPTSISWSTSANGFFKGFPGYKATLKRTGTPTAIIDGATTLDADTGIYYLDNRSTSILDKDSNVVIEDDAVAVAAADIEYIDYLQGGVKFVDTYVATGPVTISGDYLPTSPICFAQNFTLTQTSGTEDVSDFCTLQANGGYSVFSYQQLSAELSLDGFYNDDADFIDDLESRGEVIIEISPDGEGKSVARGYFRATSHSQSGDVGTTETEEVNYMLSVPEGVPKPFSWYHAADSAIPEGVKLILDLWAERAEMYFKYRPENSDYVSKGKVLIEDCSLEGSVDAVNEFSFSFQGTDGLVRELV